MSNSYFTQKDYERITPHTLARSGDLNASFDAIVGAFDKLPDDSRLREGRINFGSDDGMANAYRITMPRRIRDLADGMALWFRAVHGNDGPATVDVDGLGAVAIHRQDGAVLQAGDIPEGGIIGLRYDNAGGHFKLVSPTADAGIAITNATAARESAVDAAESAGVAAQSESTIANKIAQSEEFVTTTVARSEATVAEFTAEVRTKWQEVVTLHADFDDLRKALTSRFNALRQTLNAQFVQFGRSVEDRFNALRQNLERRFDDLRQTYSAAFSAARAAADDDIAFLRQTYEADEVLAAVQRLRDETRAVAASPPKTLGLRRVGESLQAVRAQDGERFEADTVAWWAVLPSVARLVITDSGHLEIRY